ncbi:MAG: hypothetical protein R6W77_09500 [Trueperaceae bacterium]
MTAEGFADESAPVAAGSAELQALLSDLLTVRGVAAAALAGVDGELLAGHAKDRAMLERVVGIITSALAAGTALGELFEDDAGIMGGGGANVDADGETFGGAAGGASGGPELGKIMLDFAGGPILVAPLPGGERVAIVVLEDTQGLGRARYALRGTMDRLSKASLLP